MYRRYLLLTLSLLGASAAWAADPTPSLGKGPIHISADQLVGQNRPNQQAIYSGNVVMTQGDLVVHATRLTINAQSGKIQQAVAIGSPVTLTMSAAKRHGYGDSLTYNPNSGELTLQGNAHLWQGQNEVSGPTVIYQVHTQQTQVIGVPGQRVRSVFYPNSTTQGSTQP